MLLISGPLPEDLTESLIIWSEIWNLAPENQRGLWLKVGATVALEWAEYPPRGIFNDEEIDALSRFAFFKQSYQNGRLFSTFKHLNVCDHRHVVNAKIPDRELKWAQENPIGKKGVAKLDLTNPSSLSPCLCSIPYRLKNKKGKSIHQPKQFYDRKKVTLKLLKEYGGVCGAISRHGMLYAQAHGLPALLLGQAPDHCAFAWKVNDEWQIGNNVHGWIASKKHNGWVFPWGDQGKFIPLMTSLSKKEKSYRKQRIFIWLAFARNNRDEQMNAVLFSLKQEPMNYDNWSWLAEKIANQRGTLSKWSIEETHALVELAANGLSKYPSIFIHWVYSCDDALLKKLDLKDNLEVWLAQLVYVNSHKSKTSGVLDACKRIVRKNMQEEKLMKHWGQFAKHEAKSFYASLSRRDRWQPQQKKASVQAYC